MIFVTHLRCFLDNTNSHFFAVSIRKLLQSYGCGKPRWTSTNYHYISLIFKSLHVDLYNIIMFIMTWSNNDFYLSILDHSPEAQLSNGL